MVDRNQKYEDILPFYCIFRAFGSFYCDVVILNVHVCLGRTKTRSPEFGTVLHWRPSLNITGLCIQAVTLSEKRHQVLASKEPVPIRVTVF